MFCRLKAGLVNAAVVATSLAITYLVVQWRAADTRQAVHGPRDWKHVNENGYRLIGTLVAKHFDDPPIEACDNHWPEVA